MPRIKTIERYVVVNDSGEALSWEFANREDAEECLTDHLEGLRQIAEDEKRNSND